MQRASTLPVVVIGAGPVGLAAAAHLHERDIPFVVFEVGDEVADSVRDWAHVQLFSPWELNIDAAARRLLQAGRWSSPDPVGYPTGGELIEDYLAPLARQPAIAARLRTGQRVTAVTRAGLGKVRTDGRDEAPFVVTTEGRHGVERTYARAVIDTSGTWKSPNPLGADGRPAVGERRAVDRIDTGIPDVLGRDRARYVGRRVAVVGSGHSAQNVVRDLASINGRKPGGSLTWIIRRSEPGQMFGGRVDDQLPERGRLGADVHRLVASGAVSLETGFAVDEVDAVADGVFLVATDGRKLGPFDRVVTATGFRPDLEPLRELRLDLDPALESPRALGPLIDPNVHSCGSVPPHGAAELAHPEPGFYVAGAKSYGRAPTFLLATGYEQVRSIAARLAEDHAAAAEVRLVLPATGVCSLDRTPSTDAGACCG